MKFTEFKANSLFMQTADGRTRVRFHNAFKNEPNQRLKADQEWVIGCIRLAAIGFGITYSQMVHAFKTADHKAILKRMRKTDAKLQEELKKIQLQVMSYPDPSFVPIELKARRGELRDHPCHGAIDMHEKHFFDLISKVMNFAFDSRHAFDPVPPLGKSEHTDEKKITAAVKQFKRAVKRQGKEILDINEAERAAAE